MPKKKAARGWLETVLDPEPNDPPIERKPEPITLIPALRQIGTTECAICGREVAVFLTKTNRPFVNCSFCSARIFYNGRESMRLLKKKLSALQED